MLSFKRSLPVITAGSPKWYLKSKKDFKIEYNGYFIILSIEYQHVASFEVNSSKRHTEPFDITLIHPTCN